MYRLMSINTNAGIIQKHPQCRWLLHVFHIAGGTAANLALATPSQDNGLNRKHRNPAMSKVVTAPRWWPHSLEKYGSDTIRTVYTQAPKLLCTHPDCREELNLPENNCFEDARSQKNLENQN